MKQGKRTTQTNKTRERIAQAVAKLLQKHSINEISVQDICDTAQVGVGTFYYHFHSKEAALFSVYEELDDYMQEADLCSGEDSAFVCVLNFCRRYARFATAHDIHFMKTVYGMLPKAFVDKERPIFTVLHNLLINKQNLGALPADFEVVTFCEYILILLRGITYDWCIHDGTYDLEKRITDYIGKSLMAYPAFGLH